MIDIKEIGFLAKVASKEISVATSAIKNEALKIAADEIIRKTDEILKANHDDLLEGRKKDLSSAMLDRVMLNVQRLDELSQSIVNISNQNDPIGCVFRSGNSQLD